MEIYCSLNFSLSKRTIQTLNEEYYLNKYNIETLYNFDNDYEPAILIFNNDKIIIFSKYWDEMDYDIYDFNKDEILYIEDDTITLHYTEKLEKAFIFKEQLFFLDKII